MRDPNAGRLRALVDLCTELTTSNEPLDNLSAALPDILEQLAAGSGRLLVDSTELGCETNFDWPDGASAEVRADIMAPDGAADGEERPVATLEIRARRNGQPFDAGDRSFLDAVARLAGLGCAQAALRTELLQRQRIAQDLALAAELQRSLQPNFDPEAMPIWGVNRPARHVSGDFFDFFRLDDELFAFALGDVSGKGMNAALMMAKTISLFRCLGKRIDAPGALLEAINEELCETATRGMFVTMVTGHFNLRDGTVRFANAGHEPPLLRRKDRTYETFPASAPPLGIVTGSQCTEVKVALDGGEFYVFSDGLTEYRYANGEQLGTHGFIQLVETMASEPPARRLEAVLDLLEQDPGWEARDDLTVLAIDDSWAGSGFDMTPAPMEATA
ncbi:MAG: PP2C family protein-serine/threonine phosphatase [Alphaproteobacteria bacterium]